MPPKSIMEPPKNWLDPTDNCIRPKAPDDIDDNPMAAMMAMMRMSSQNAMGLNGLDVEHEHKKIAFTLKISFRGPKPEIWRRVRVPATLSLSDFHSKVLIPAVGWAPNAHAYAFFRKPFDKNPGRES
eukprot:gene28002-31098_t